LTVRLSPGLHRRRGALPRPPDRVQVLDDLPWPPTLRTEVLEQFPVKARLLARNAA
jgi:hypothetical protein